MSGGSESFRLNQLCDRIFLLGLLAAIAFVLWLPVLPTGDGPVHLYYADILQSLLRRQPVYAGDYAIRHLLAPYLVHYLALICFEVVLSPAAAEKVFVAVIFATTAFGFRRLARSLGGNAGIACIWMLPLLFSWSLGGGFLNCCSATGIALFCWPLWIRLSRASSLARGHLWAVLSCYALLLMALVLSHPVPLLVLLLFTASDLFLQVIDPLRRRAFLLRPLLPQCAALALTSAAFVAPVLLAQKGQAAAVLPEIGFHRDVLIELIGGMRLGLFAGINATSVAGWLSILARVLLVGIVPAAAWLVLNPASRLPAGGSAWVDFLPVTPAARLTLISIVYLAATIFFPRSLNHSYFFPQRMWDIVWLLVAACIAGATLTSRQQRYAAGLGLLSIGLTAALGLPSLARIAFAQRALAAASLPPAARGLFLEADSAEQGRGSATSYPVWFWAGARAFESSHAILLNSPWLGLTILPVRDADRAQGLQALLDRGFPSILSENPIALTHALLPDGGSAILKAQRRAILERADFLLYVDPPRPGAAPDASAMRRAALAITADPGHLWECRPSPSFYVLCTKAR